MSQHCRLVVIHSGDLFPFNRLSITLIMQLYQKARNPPLFSIETNSEETICPFDADVFCDVVARWERGESHSPAFFESVLSLS